MPVSARTRVAGVIGHPVRHSLSPVIMNAAFEAAALDWVYLAFDVQAVDAADAVRAVRSLDLVGLNVTMPHKDAAARAVDRLTSAAARLGAVNCVTRVDDELVGDNTDGAGFIWSLERRGIEVAGRRCVVLGAGGAARSVIVALADAGAADVAVINRDAQRGVVAAELAGAVGRSADLSAIDPADLVVNATPVGMAVPDGPAVPGGDAAGECVVPPGSLRPGHVVVDLVYHPERTPLLAAAEAAGATVIGGLGMLVGQAALAFELWSGKPAPRGVMHAAALGALASR